MAVGRVEEPAQAGSAGRQEEKGGGVARVRGGCITQRVGVWVVDGGRTLDVTHRLSRGAAGKVKGELTGVNLQLLELLVAAGARAGCC